MFLWYIDSVNIWWMDQFTADKNFGDHRAPRRRWLENGNDPGWTDTNGQYLGSFQ